MPDWENNYLSWSFGLGFVGVVFQYVSGILFLVEARIIQRKEVSTLFVYCLFSIVYVYCLLLQVAREKQYPMEQRV